MLVTAIWDEFAYRVVSCCIVTEWPGELRRLRLNWSALCVMRVAGRAGGWVYVLWAGDTSVVT